MTAISIIASEALYACIAILLGGVSPIGFLMGGIIPAIITFPVSLLFFRVAFQLENAEKSLKQAYQESKELQAQLVQSGKLASLGELAAGIAHELNQPLTVIRANSQLILKQSDEYGLERSSLRDMVGTIEKSTRRMMNIINHLRTFSRQSTGEFSTFELNRVLEDCFFMVGQQLRNRDIRVETELEAALPKIRGDASQIEQVFLNLITNARDSIESRMMDEKGQQRGPDRTKGMIRIQTRTCPDNDKWIEALVSDNGSGIEAGLRERIFDPFFTTKEVGMGTGLGLSISYGIIKKHGGDIQVMQTGLNGTTMKVQLPILDEEAKG